MAIKAGMLNIREIELRPMSTAATAIEHDEIAVLRLLALKGGLGGDAEVSCAGLSEDLDVSTQTVSRRLQRLEDAEMIRRERVSGGQRITLTEDGRELLREEFETYQRIFGDGSSVTLRGAVTDGMGEGRHYIPLEGYRVQFVERLGYEPYPGTLNLTLDADGVRRRRRIESLPSITIDGWEGEDRTYGPAACYPATVRAAANDPYRKAHAIVPERTHHDDDQLELIAPDRLRDTLELVDGDVIDVELSGAED